MSAIIEHEGVKYRKVEREAVEGDVVRMKLGDYLEGFNRGDIFTVHSAFVDKGGYTRELSDHKHDVLESVENPLADAPTTPTLPKLTDAKPGDTVRITDAKDISGYGYQNGDVFSVEEVWHTSGGVGTTTGIQLYAEEFEVVSPHSDSFGEQLAQSLEQAAQLVGGTLLADGEKPANETQADRIGRACDELSALLIRKNHDYGDSFAQQYAKYGLTSAMIRMDDKMRRLETLQSADALVAESTVDTLLDLAGYALLAAVEVHKAES